MNTPPPKKKTPNPLGAARRALDRITPARRYPDGVHPALVPGISVDEQRYRYGTDKIVFWITGLALIAFVVWGVTSPFSVSVVSSQLFGWVITNAGWLFNLVAAVCLVYLLAIAFSKYGNIRLGRDDEKPEFSRFSWVAMLFAAGIGIGMFFFGPSEPLGYFLDPPPETFAQGTPESLHQAIAQTTYHWGLHAWAMYTLVGGAIAYSTYRRGRVPLLSAIFTTILGKSPSKNWVSKIIDIAAIFATVFGTAASLGLAAMSIGEGVKIVAGWDEVSNAVLIGILAILTAAFIVSAVSGVARGIRYLSNINMTLTFGFMIFIFALGPTLFLLNLVPSGLMFYFDQMFAMMSKSVSWGPEAEEFQSLWTVFYWAWWISWTPFVGTFISRISRGRTIREFILVVLFVPTLVLHTAYTIMGGTTIYFSREGREGFDGSLTQAELLFNLIDQFPLAPIITIVVMICLAIFFVTSADSASVIMGTLSQRGDTNPKKGGVIFWGLAMMGIAVVMLLTGGETALTGLQNLVIITALPFALVLLFTMYAFYRELRTDPYSLRQRYARRAVATAVRRGLADYGDEFEISVERAREGYSAAGDIDSTAEELTGWYVRHDEDGEPVAYDYETNSYADGWVNPDPTPQEVPQSDETAAADSAEQPATDEPSASSNPDDGTTGSRS
ncbi:BCCT family transporter [Micrococcoides hystricis]|uniref:BCCT family transporter n=1 Tax=Micrococcoides hystricis TaxID=1572761 RepID=A0ABV6PCY8_9MICC